MDGTFLTDFNADELQTAEKNLQNFLFIQLDDDLSTSPTSWLKPIYERQNGGYKLELFVGLRSISQNVYRFHNTEDCFTCLRSINNHSVILIISRTDLLNDKDKSMLMALPHITSIYLFGYSTPWQKPIPKLLDQPSQIFVMHQLLSELLMNIPKTDRGKSDFLVFSLKTFGKDAQFVHDTHQFDRMYAPDQAIWWYTKSVFVYRLLGRLCHSYAPNLIFKIRFYVVDLFEQMKMLHQVQQSTLFTVDFLDVYRGKFMSIQDLDHLKINKDKLHVLTRFLSTVTSREVALLYSGDGRVWDVNHVSVLFHIRIDMKKNVSQPIALIREYSSIPDENEILLPMGLLFRITSIQQVKEKLWKIQMIADVEQESFNTHLQKQINRKNIFLSMTDLIQDIHDTQHESKHFQTIPLTKVEQTDRSEINRLSTKNYNDENDESTASVKSTQSEKIKETGCSCC